MLTVSLILRAKTYVKMSVCGILLCGLIGCGEAPVDIEEPIRGLRTFTVADKADSIERRYPSVIQPHDETRLAFEVGGQLQSVDLEEGQSVKRNDVLLMLDPSTYQLRVQEAQASFAQAEAVHRNARSDFERKSELWKKRVIPKSTFDDAVTELDSAAAQLDGTRKRLEIAKDDLGKTKLRAPFSGVIARVEVDSFATVNPGQSTLTLYAEDAFETEFTVPSTVINSLALGQPVKIFVNDLANEEYRGRITELGSRAAEVSAFPAIAVLEGASTTVKAGMSADVVIDVALPQQSEGFLIPLSCFSFKAVDQLHPQQTSASVFVYNEQMSVVEKRTIEVSDVKENMVIVLAGLSAGDKVASAGVSYLRDGQRVKLLGDK